LTLSKSNLRNIFLIVFGISIFIVIFFTYDTSCGVEHMSLLNIIKIYEKSFDPEFCESILERINSFNNQCTPIIEILDCG
tara:strand:- start:701 stop:940 length:240 start_codon:yes stop_codon:yes gene_type:complete